MLSYVMYIMRVSGENMKCRDQFCDVYIVCTGEYSL